MEGGPMEHNASYLSNKLNKQTKTKTLHTSRQPLFSLPASLSVFCLLSLPPLPLPVMEQRDMVLERWGYLARRETCSERKCRQVVEFAAKKKKKKKQKRNGET